MPKKSPYAEGDWIAVPLRDRDYAIGLIARKGKGKVLFGYFFKPRFKEVPTLNQLHDITLADVILAAMFGDLGLINGEWFIIGHFDSWQRDFWVLPLFMRVDCVSGEVSLIEYSEDDLSVELSSRPCSSSEIQDFPKDGLFGYGAVEILLTKLLAQSPTS